MASSKTTSDFESEDVFCKMKIPCKKCKNTSWRRTSFHKVRKDKEDKFDITKVKKNASKFLTGRYQAGK